MGFESRLRALALCGPAPTSAQQIECGAEFQKRVRGRINAIDARNGVKDDVLLFRAVFDYRLRQSDDSEVQQSPLLRPVDGVVIYDIFRICQLDLNAAHDGA